MKQNLESWVKYLNVIAASLTGYKISWTSLFFTIVSGLDCRSAGEDKDIKNKENKQIDAGRGKCICNQCHMRQVNVIQGCKVSQMTRSVAISIWLCDNDSELYGSLDLFKNNRVLNF